MPRQIAPDARKALEAGSADGGCDRDVTRGESAAENRQVQDEINDVAHGFGSGHADKLTIAAVRAGWL
jgi:hypothetical protein